MPKDENVLGSYCGVCGGWLAPTWRACPTCATRMPNADKIDRREKIAAAGATVSGLVLVIASVMKWADITASKLETVTRSGFPRGILVTIFGIVAIVIGVYALINRRFKGNRSTLTALGVITIIWALFQRNLLKWQLNDIAFDHPDASLNYTVALPLMILGGIALIVCGQLLPKQLPVKEPSNIRTRSEVVGASSTSV